MRACVVFLLTVQVVGAAEYVLAPDGRDTRRGGTTNAPWRGLEYALRFVNYGDTLWVRGGTYRQNLRNVSMRRTKGGSPTNRLRIWAWPGERPVFSGAIELNGWQAETNGIPVVKVASVCDYPNTLREPPRLIPDRIVGFAAHPGTAVWSLPSTALHPQVFCVTGTNRIPLTQVGWSSPKWSWLYRKVSERNYVLMDKRGTVADGNITMPPWSFCSVANRLFVRLGRLAGADITPQNSTIEAGAHTPFSLANIDWLHLRGITMRHSSLVNDVGPSGWVGVALGYGALVENCIVEWMDLDGFHARAGSVISNCVFRFNGRTGFQAGSGHFQLLDSLILSNNWRGFEQCDHAAGAKIISLRPDYGGTIIAGNQFVGNNARGLWIDTVNPDAGRIEVFNNQILFNRPGGPYGRPGGKGLCPPASNRCGPGGGITLENSGSISLVNNLVLSNSSETLNHTIGISIGSSTNCEVFHNTVVVGGPGIALSMQTQSPRPVPFDNDVRNNVFVSTHRQNGVVLQGGITIKDQFYDILERSLLNANAYYAPTQFTVTYQRDASQRNDCANLSRPCTLEWYFQQVRPRWETLSFLATSYPITADGKPRPVLIDKGIALSSRLTATDFNKKPRDSKPDLGAIEAQPPSAPRFR